MAQEMQSDNAQTQYTVVPTEELATILDLLHTMDVGELFEEDVETLRDHAEENMQFSESTLDSFNRMYGQVSKDIDGEFSHDEMLQRTMDRYGWETPAQS